MIRGWLTIAALVAWAATLLIASCSTAPARFDDMGLDRAEPATPPAPNLAAIDGQDTFAAFAWNQLGQVGAPPPIEWHREGCEGSPDFFPKASEPGKCVNGTYHPGDRFIRAAVMPTPALSAVCHEYQHVIDWRDRQIADVEHTGAAFQPGGAVEACEAAMAKAGW